MKVTRVAAAVILASDGQDFLLAQRPVGKPYPGYWEFPGGKIEPGETALSALTRELKEELDIEVIEASPWITRVHAYTHATVHLAFFRVTAWRGELRGMEGQNFTWVKGGSLTVGPMLPANAPIFRSLQLPRRMLITPVGLFDEPGAPRAMTWQDATVKRRELGDVLTQVRDPELREISGPWGATVTDWIGALAATPALSRRTKNAVVINTSCLNETSVPWAGEWPPQVGLHMTAVALRQAAQRPNWLHPEAWWGASCHDAKELAQAVRLGVDYVVLGPVLPTASHPGDPGMGWEKFRRLTEDLPMPVYAIGGLRPESAEIAERHGAHGIATLSALG
jgi:8-oxo-dGTP diphosphatase